MMYWLKFKFEFKDNKFELYTGVMSWGIVVGRFNYKKHGNT